LFTIKLVDVPGIIAWTPTKDSVGSPRDMALTTIFHLHGMQSSHPKHKRICKDMCIEACVTANCTQKKVAHPLHPHVRIRPQTGFAYYWKVCSLPTVRFWICQQPVRHDCVVRNGCDTHKYSATQKHRMKPCKNPRTPPYIWSRSLWKLIEPFVSLGS